MLAACSLQVWMCTYCSTSTAGGFPHTSLNYEASKSVRLIAMDCSGEAVHSPTGGTSHKTKSTCKLMQMPTWSRQHKCLPYFASVNWNQEWQHLHGEEVFSIFLVMPQIRVNFFQVNWKHPEQWQTRGVIEHHRNALLSDLGHFYKKATHTSHTHNHTRHTLLGVTDYWSS